MKNQLIILVIAMIILSSISYSMSDEEFRQQMREVHEAIEHLRSSIAQNKLDVADKLKTSTDYILTEVQGMFITLDEKVEERTDPMSFSMPVISFFLAIICFYVALLGIWWAKYSFFKKREDYIKQLEHKAKGITDADYEEAFKDAGPKKKPKVNSAVMLQLEQERKYQEMIKKQKAHKTKGLLLFVVVAVIFLVIGLIFILPQIGIKVF